MSTGTGWAPPIVPGPRPQTGQSFVSRTTAPLHRPSETNACPANVGEILCQAQCPAPSSDHPSESGPARWAFVGDPVPGASTGLSDVGGRRSTLLEGRGGGRLEDTRVIRGTRGLRRRWRLRFQRNRLSARCRGFASPAAAYQGGAQRFPRVCKWLRAPVAVRGARPP